MFDTELLQDILYLSSVFPSVLVLNTDEYIYKVLDRSTALLT